MERSIPLGRTPHCDASARSLCSGRSRPKHHAALPRHFVHPASADPHFASPHGRGPFAFRLGGGRPGPNNSSVRPDPSRGAVGQTRRRPELEHRRGEELRGSRLRSAGFLAALSVVDRITIPHDVYDSTLRSTWEHLHEQHWVWDTDPFNMNQFAHPYQGAMMFGFARSTGVSFWQSLAYSNAGSFIWKMAGETDLPSINDQLTTGTAGALLGESLFRMSSLLAGGRRRTSGLLARTGGCGDLSTDRLQPPRVWRPLQGGVPEP
jgi:hypothetical protein